MDADVLNELVAALEKQYGSIAYVTVCSSFEDSLEFQRIANIGVSTLCEELGCGSLSVSCCCFCDKAICMYHSRDTISDEGHDAYACSYCTAETA